VDDALAVRIRDRIGDGDDVVEHADPLVDRRARREQVAQRTAGDELHGIERGAVGPTTRLVDRHDARVLEARRDQCFAQKANLAEIATREQLLDRDLAAEIAVVGAEHAADAAAAMLAEDLVAIRVADRNRGALAGRSGRAGQRRLAGVGLHRVRRRGCRKRALRRVRCDLRHPSQRI
jgi:hypothetical protein